MQITFGFTNTTAQSAAVVGGKKLGLASTYTTTELQANKWAGSNKTAPIDAEEKVSFRSRDLQKVNTSLNIQNPAPKASPVEYSGSYEVAAMIKDDNGIVLMQEPIVITMTVKHNRNGLITGTVINSLFERAVSMFYDNEGNQRFDDLMRSGEQPTHD